MFDRYKKITNDVVNLVSGVSKESQKNIKRFGAFETS